MIKDAVLALLWEHADAFLSGEELARSLSVSRAAVSKAVGQLREEGYLIRAATRRGYRLSSGSDVLSAPGVARYLRDPAILPRVEQCVTSTNTVLKAMAEQGAPEGTALIAGRQTQGRGRRGRSFYSPADTGVYLSLLLRPPLAAAEATGLTACAAVAACEAIEALSGRPAQIKWVNDVLVDGKKVCGILTEASVDWESGMADYVVVGVGINTRVPDGDFPEELRGVAGAAFGAQPVPELRCRLAAAVLDGLMECYRHLGDGSCYERYRSRSLIPGKPIRIFAPGKEPVRAEALDIGEDFSLIVRLEDGTVRRLSSGEVSVRTE